MGTVLKVLGVVFLLVVLAIAGALYCAHEAGESLQEGFFTDVLGGDVAKLKARFHPQLRDQLDEPVLAAWMAAVKEHLGAFEGLAGDKFSTNMKTENGVTTVESTGTVKFTKGTAESALKTVEGKITAFQVTSDVLPGNWFTKLDDVSFYDARAQRFVTKLLTGDGDGALAMMHEKLRAKFKPEDFKASLAAMAERFGALASVELTQDEFTPEPPQQLILSYALATAKGGTTGYVRFEFDFQRMRAHLVGFAVPDSR